MVEGESFDLESGIVREEVTEVKEEDLGQVQQDTKNAKKVAKQIKQSQMQNKQQAGLLSILLNEVSDDTLVSYIGEELFTHHVSIPFIYAQYLPYLHERREIEDFLATYSQVADVWHDTPNSLSGYALYLGRLRAAFPQLQQIPEEEYVAHMYRLFIWMELVVPTDWDEEKETSFLNSLRKQLLG